MQFETLRGSAALLLVVQKRPEEAASGRSDSADSGTMNAELPDSQIGKSRKTR
jgi:hypothetical protein